MDGKNHLKEEFNFAKRKGGVYEKMATIVRKAPGETEDKLIAKFKKKILAEQLLNELKEREFYKPPSVRKKEKLAALRRARKRK